MTRQLRNEGFLSRWARRKAEEQIEGEAPEVENRQSPVEAEPSPSPSPDTEVGPEEALDELPDPESLGPEDDWSPFLKRGVPPEIRTKALRRLWRLDPVFANLDGLVDYAEDYNGTQFTGQPVKTLFQVGRGMLVEDEPKPPEEMTEEAPAETSEKMEVPVAEEATESKAAVATAPALIEDSEKDAAAAQEVADDSASQPLPAKQGGMRRALARRWGLGPPDSER